MTDAKYSPLPWHWAGSIYEGVDYAIEDLDGTPIAHVMGQPGGIDNTPFILRACNSHSAMVEALRTAVETIRALHGDVGWELYYDGAPEMKAIRAALALAEKEST